MEHLYVIQSAQDPDAFVVIREEPGMYIIGSLVTSIAHFANSFPSAPRELVGVRTDHLKLSTEKESPYLSVLTPLASIRSEKPPTSLWYHILEKKVLKPASTTPAQSPNAKRKLDYDTDDEIQTPEKRRRLNADPPTQRTDEEKNEQNQQRIENNTNNNNNWRELSDGLLVSVPLIQGQSPTRSPKNVTTRKFDTDVPKERNDKTNTQPKVKPVILYTPAAVKASKEKQTRSSPAPTTSTQEPEKKSAETIRERFGEETRRMFSETLHATANPWITPNYLFLVQGFPSTMPRQKIYDKIEDFFKTDKIATNPTFDIAQHKDNKNIVLLSLENKTVSKRLIDKTFNIGKYSVTFVHVPIDLLPELPRERKTRKQL